ncbi:MAG: DinB family protein [Bacteroidetes bacterium]|nr:DinB family protein [Bacteroidota bacterium]
MHMLKDLFHHMHWADATVWNSVLETEAAAGDNRVTELFYHIHSVQRAFLAVWTSTPIAMPKREHFVSMQQLADWGRTYHKEVFDLMPDFTDDRLEQNITVPWSRFMEQRYAHKPEETTVHETMLQVLLHSSYHRGQVNARLRELGAEPPMVDYIGWLWFGRPAAEWK